MIVWKSPRATFAVKVRKVPPPWSDASGENRNPERDGKETRNKRLRIKNDSKR